MGFFIFFLNSVQSRLKNCEVEPGLGDYFS